MGGFVAHVLTFMPVQVIDIRPLESEVSDLSFKQTDATHLTGIGDNTIESLSCLHAVEHFDLGRYGDKVNPEACFMAMRSMARVLLPEKGRLYLSVPIGKQRVEFNSHRIFSPGTVLQTLGDLRLLSFSAVRDGTFDPDTEPSRYESSRFACGLFEFGKSA